MTVDDLDLFNSVIRVRNGETKNGAGLMETNTAEYAGILQVDSCRMQVSFLQAGKGRLSLFRGI